MAYPTPSFKGFDLRLMFNQGDFGWSETYYLAYTEAAFRLAEQDAFKLMTSRRAILTSDAALVACRISPFKSRTDPTVGQGLGSELVTGVGSGCGPGMVADAGPNPTPSWDGLLVTLEDASRLYRRSLIMRGLPSQYILWNAAGLAGLTVLGKGKVAPYLLYIMGGNVDPNNPLALTGVPSIRGRSHDPAVTLQSPILAMAPTTDGCNTQLQPLATPEGWAPGTRVHLHNVGGCGTRGLNGDAVIMPVTALAPYTIVVNRVASCCGPYKIGPSGVIYAIVEGLYPISPQTAANGQVDPILAAGRIVKRNTGGPSLGTRGRRSASRR